MLVVGMNLPASRLAAHTGSSGVHVPPELHSGALGGVAEAARGGVIVQRGRHAVSCPYRGRFDTRLRSCLPLTVYGAGAQPALVSHLWHSGGPRYAIKHGLYTSTDPLGGTTLALYGTKRIYYAVDAASTLGMACGRGRRLSHGGLSADDRSSQCPTMGRWELPWGT